MKNLTNLNSITERFANIGNVITFALVSFALIYIIYYIVMYFIKGKSGDEGRSEAGMQILWGIIGLFLILSLWGLVNILIGTFGTNNNVPKDRIPSADFINSNSNSSFDTMKTKM